MIEQVACAMWPDPSRLEVMAAVSIVELNGATASEAAESARASVPPVKDALDKLAGHGLAERQKRDTGGRGRDPVEYLPRRDLVPSETGPGAAVPASLDGVPLSAKLVALSLIVNGEQTQLGLMRTTQLSQRTVRDALERLDPESRPNFEDARQRYYSL